MRRGLLWGLGLRRANVQVESAWGTGLLAGAEVLLGREGELRTLLQDLPGSETVKLLERGEFTCILKVLSKSMSMFVCSPLTGM